MVKTWGQFSSSPVRISRVGTRVQTQTYHLLTMRLTTIPTQLLCVKTIQLTPQHQVLFYGCMLLRDFISMNKYLRMISYYDCKHGPNIKIIFSTGIKVSRIEGIK